MTLTPWRLTVISYAICPYQNSYVAIWFGKWLRMFSRFRLRSLGWSGSGSVIQDLSGLWCIWETDKSITRIDLSVPFIHHHPDRSWITDPDPDHPKGMQPLFINSGLKDTSLCILWIPCIIQENLFYVTVNNKFVIGREIKKGKGEVCITTDNFNLNAMFFRLRIWWRMTNSSISKA